MTYGAASCACVAISCFRSASRLAPVLRTSDMRAFELLDEGRAALDRTNPTLLAALDLAMDALDFDRAAQLCEAAIAGDPSP